MTTATKSKRTRERRRKALPPTLGKAVCRWIERYLVHAEGDYLGQPFRLKPWQRRVIYEAYELEPHGGRRYDRVLLGLPKGNGKTELAAAIACAEFAGPVCFDGWKSDGEPAWKARVSPDIPVAAASFEQANILFSAAKLMMSSGPLGPLFDSFDTSVEFKDGRPGSLYRVAAAAGTNDGRKPTFLAADELHEWEGRKERVHLVLSNGRAKRSDAWEMNISTAGWNLETLLGRLYLTGKKGLDPRFLFIWMEAPVDADLTDEEQLREAIRSANPAVGDFLPEENIVRRYGEMPEFEFRRYHLNQWTSTPERWMDEGLWRSRADTEREVARGTPIVLGFDGSYTRDSTALVGCTVEERPHLFLVGLWERPDGVSEWTVDKDEVEKEILEACSRWEVRSLPADDTFGRIWSMVLEGLAEKGVEVLEWPTRSPSRMAPACGAFWGAVKDGTLSHDGDPRLTGHILNCVTKTDRFGPRIVKEHRGSTKHIDAAVAGVIAHDMATRQPSTFRSRYEEEGLEIL